MSPTAARRSDHSLAGRRVLVTGAAGWIGAHLVRNLLSDDAAVSVLIRPSTDSWRLADVLDRVQLLTCDLEDHAAVAQAVERTRPEVCLHLAWPAEPGTYLQDRRNLAALSSTLRLVTLLAKAGCLRFVGTGSCAEYEPSFGWLSEETRASPQSLYAAAKLASWLLIEQLARGGPMTVAWARLFYQFGPMEDARRLVPSIVTSLLAGQMAPLTPGEQVRDFLHVSDVASALVRVAGSGQEGIVNIGSGVPTTVATLASAVAKALGRPSLLAFGALPYAKTESMFICANTARLRSTGWRPAFSLAEGVADTVGWWTTKSQGGLRRTG